MNVFLQLIALVSLQQISLVVNGQSYVLTSSCGGVITEGSSCVLTCETGDVTETPIAWTRGTSATYEVDRASCTTPNPAAPSDYVLACPGTSFTLNITAASVTRDKTTWTCDSQFGGKESNPIDLDVKDISTSTSTTEGSTGASTTPGICKNHLYYLFLLLPLMIIPMVVCCRCNKRNRRKK